MTREWKTKELQALFARRKAGTPTLALAKEVGVSEGALRSAWRRLGLMAQETRVRVPYSRSKQCSRAYTLHIAGKTWAEVAVAVEWEGSISSMCSSVRRWARRAGVLVQWRGNSERAQRQRLATRRAHAREEVRDA